MTESKLIEDWKEQRGSYCSLITVVEVGVGRKENERKTKSLIVPLWRVEKKKKKKKNWHGNGTRVE